MVPLSFCCEQSFFLNPGDLRLENRVTEVALTCLAGAAIGIAMGIVFSASPISTFFYALTGLSIGLTSLVATYFFNEDPKIRAAGLELETFQQEVQNQELLELSEKVKNFFICSYPKIDYPHQLHELYDTITDITDKVRFNPRLKEIWGCFLRSIQGVEIRCTGGHTEKFDPGKIFGRLEGIEPQFAVELKDSASLSSLELQELHRLYLQAFGGRGFLCYSPFAFWLSRHNYIHYLARDEQGEIIGWLAYVQENDNENHICYLARRADVAKAGVAAGLFHRFFQDQGNQPAYLEVSSSNNRAITFYERWGFRFDRVLPGYYSQPREDGLKMTFSPRSQANIAS
jgi:ribosomal protein S18 acetylase RimI-like enzyme